MNKEHKRILIILLAIILAFMTLIIYLTYFQIFQAESVKNNNYNKRQWINEEKIMRGSILDRNGLELAHSVRDENSEITRRVYDYKNLYSHIIGYSYREYGKTGLEHSFNNTLLGIEESSTINEIKKMVESEKIGNSIRTSLDHKLQVKTRDLLEGKKGSIVTMNPKTGEIYSMVSFPDFDASNLKEDWKSISEDSNSPLLNRATQGLYEPGSTFKILTASSILNNGLGEDYLCRGTTKIDGYTFKDYNPKGHGEIDLDKALVKSCNNYFVEKAVELGKENFGRDADKFYLNKKLPLEIATTASIFNYKEKMEETELAASGIGQGKVLVTPLNMAVITSSIVNNGRLMEPSLVKEVIDKDGNIIDFKRPKELSRVLSEENANYLKGIMGNVVKQGTGTNARISGITVGGKTGTAENSSGRTHAWFVGFAPVEDPAIVTVVVLEEAGGTGGKLAAPLAKETMEYAIKTLGY